MAALGIPQNESRCQRSRSGLAKFFNHDHVGLIVNGSLGYMVASRQGLRLFIGVVFSVSVV